MGWTIKNLGSVIKIILQDDICFFLFSFVDSFKILRSEGDGPVVSPAGNLERERKRGWSGKEDSLIERKSHIATVQIGNQRYFPSSDG